MARGRPRTDDSEKSHRSRLGFQVALFTVSEKMWCGTDAGAQTHAAYREAMLEPAV